MDILDFAEQQGQRASAYSQSGLDLMNARAQTLLAMLTAGAGAGASGAYALGYVGKPGGWWVVCGLGAVSIWWFVLSGWLAWRVLSTQEVTAPARTGQKILDQAKKYDDYIVQAKAEGEAPEDCLTMLRQMELRLLDKSRDDHAKASVEKALKIDRVYKAVSATPLLAVLGLLLAWRLI